MTEAVVTLDLHGKNKYQAKTAIDALLRRSRGISHVRLIHGFNRGTELREFIRDEYSGHAAVRRLDCREPGITVLILREL